MEIFIRLVSSKEDELRGLVSKKTDRFIAELSSCITRRIERFQSSQDYNKADQMEIIAYTLTFED